MSEQTEDKIASETPQIDQEVDNATEVLAEKPNLGTRLEELNSSMDDAKDTADTTGKTETVTEVSDDDSNSKFEDAGDQDEHSIHSTKSKGEMRDEAGDEPEGAIEEANTEVKTENPEHIKDVASIDSLSEVSNEKDVEQQQEIKSDAARAERDSISGSSLLKSNEQNLVQKIESLSDTSDPPQLPPRDHVADQDKPTLPPRSHLATGFTGPVHFVPPPLTDEMKSKKFREQVKKHKRSDSSDFDLILNRFVQNDADLELRDEKERENAQKGIDALRETYDSLVDKTEKELVQYDWPFWSQLVHNYSQVVRDNSKQLEEEVGKGIPPQIRGIVWQLLTNSNYKEMEELYSSLLELESPHEKAIRRDLMRTKFIPQEKTDSLFSVLKAYSLYDPPVGYTQGMGFIATTFIINCDEEWKAFSLLVQIMKVYGLRDLFLPGMPGLMLKLYQFDTLLEEHNPQLYNHLRRQEIRSSMFATQWFLTMFAYKFPLDFVLRIMDIVVLEGIESVLKFGLTLLLKNSRKLIVLSFDSLLDFLKEDLFQHYAKNDGSDEYDIDTFISDSLEIKITPLQLERYVKEYEEIHKLETERQQQFEEQRIKNRQLQKELRKLEHDYSLLNREHITIANELIENRLRMETLQDENTDLKQEIQDLKTQLQREIYKQSLPNPDSQIPTDLKADLSRTMERNLEVMNENQELRERLDELEKESYELRTGKTWTKDVPSPRASRIGTWTFKSPWK